MNIHPIYIVAAIVMMVGVGAVMAHPNPVPSLYVQETVKLQNGKPVSILEDRKRNRLCYIVMETQSGYGVGGITCGPLDGNNPQ